MQLKKDDSAVSKALHAIHLKDLEKIEQNNNRKQNDLGSSNSDSEFDSPNNSFSNLQEQNVRIILPKSPKRNLKNDQNNPKNLEIKNPKKNNKKNLKLNRIIPTPEELVSPTEQHSPDICYPHVINNNQVKHIVRVITKIILSQNFFHYIIYLLDRISR